jgi:hypothetical protein
MEPSLAARGGWRRTPFTPGGGYEGRFLTGPRWGSVSFAGRLQKRGSDIWAYIKSPALGGTYEHVGCLQWLTGTEWFVLHCNVYPKTFDEAVILVEGFVEECLAGGATVAGRPRRAS